VHACPWPVRLSTRELSEGFPHIPLDQICAARDARESTAVGRTRLVPDDAGSDEAGLKLTANRCSRKRHRRASGNSPLRAEVVLDSSPPRRRPCPRVANVVFFSYPKIGFHLHPGYGVETLLADGLKCAIAVCTMKKLAFNGGTHGILQHVVA